MSVENEWNEKLYDCTKDCGTCCYGFWCTPCLFGSNAEKIDNQNCCLMCCLYGILANCYLCWVPHWMERQRLRRKYNLKEDPCDDCPTTVFCGPCALCQEAREMKRRGNQPGVTFKPNGGAPIIYQPGSNPNPYPNPYPNSYPNQNPHPHPHPHTYQNQNSYPNSNQNAYPYQYQNSYPNQNQNAYSYEYQNSYPNQNQNAYSYEYQNSYPNSNPYPYLYSNNM